MSWAGFRLIIGHGQGADGVVTWDWLPSPTLTYTPDPGFSGYRFVQLRDRLDRSRQLRAAAVSVSGRRVLLRRLRQRIRSAVAVAPTVTANDVSGDEDTNIALDVSVVLDPLDTDGSETAVVVMSNFPAGSTVSPGTDLGGGSYQFTLAQLASAQFTPQLGISGAYSIDVAVTVTDDATPVNIDVTVVNDSFNLTVNSINQAPTVVGPVPSVTVDEDAPNSSDDVTSVFDDFDILTNGDFLTYSVEGAIPAFLISADASSGSLILDFAPELNGSGNVTVRATDDQGPAFVEVSVPVTVNAINDAPTVVGAVSVTADEDDGNSSDDITAVFDDVDIATNGDSLTYAVVSALPPFLVSADASSGSLVLDYAAEQNGSANVTVRATDAGAPGLFVDYDVSVTVNSVADAPFVANAMGTENATEDGPIVSRVLTLVFDDVDIATNGDSLSYAVTSNSNPALFTSVSIAGGVLSADLLPDANGSATIVVEASDTTPGTPLTVTDSLTINVAAVNDAPTVIGGLTVNATEDDPNSSDDLSPVFDDVDIATNGDSLSYTIQGPIPPFLTSADPSSGFLVLDFAPEQNGSGSVTVRATDSGAPALFVDYVVNVNVSAASDGPFVANAMGTENTVEDGPNVTRNLNLVFDDVDIATNGDTLSFAVVGNSNPAVFSSVSIAGGVLTAVLAPDANGFSNITVEASDTTPGTPLTVTDTLTINIAAANDAPTVVGSASVTADEDDPTSADNIASVFDDVDIISNGDVLTYSVVGALPPFLASADPSSGFLVLDYAPDQNGTGNVTVRATDSGSPALFVDYNVSVTVNAVPDQPIVVNPMGVENTVEDGPDVTRNLVLVFDDVDIATNGDSLTYAVTAVANPAIFTSVTISANTLIVDLAPNAVGASTITVTASDSTPGTPLTVDDVLTVNITQTNDAPTVVGALSVTVDEDSGQSSDDITAVFDDVDIVTNGDSLSYSIVGGLPPFLAAADPSSGALVLDYAPDQNGSANVTVRATDTGMLFVDYDVSVTVNAVDDQPIVVNPMGTENTVEDGANVIRDLNLVFDDADIMTNGDSLGFTVTANSNPGLFTSVSIVGGTLTLDLAPDANGTASVTVTATDTTPITPLTETDTLTVNVSPTNDAPTVIAGIADITVDEDAPNTSVSVVGSFDDIDIATNGDSLTYSVFSVVGDAIFDSFDATGGSLVLDYTANAYGTATVTVRATDQGGLWDQTTVFVTVNPINDPPFVDNPMGTRNAVEDGPNVVVDLTSVFDDVDGDLLTITIVSVSNPSLLNPVVIVGGSLDIALVPDANGIGTVTVRATDPSGATITDTVTVDVSGVDDLPVAANDNETIDEDSAPTSFDVMANDYLGDPPTIDRQRVVGDHSHDVHRPVRRPDHGPERHDHVHRLGNYVRAETRLLGPQRSGSSRLHHSGRQWTAVACDSDHQRQSSQRSANGHGRARLLGCREQCAHRGRG